MTEKPIDQAGVRFRIRSLPAELSQVRARVSACAESVGFPDADVARIALAVDEAIANVIHHGYGGPCDEPIDIVIKQITLDGRPAIQIVIRDFGKQVEPAMICGRPLERVRPGGLGVHIIRSVMDQVIYAPARDGGMRMTMRKKKNP